jgi:hypothetical protein
LYQFTSGTFFGNLSQLSIFLARLLHRLAMRMEAACGCAAANAIAE